MIKRSLLIKLLKQRLAHNQRYLDQGTEILTALNLDVSPLDKTPGYRKAVEEENAFLRAVLEDHT
jgi:hypothetical protein